MFSRLLLSIVLLCGTCSLAYADAQSGVVMEEDPQEVSWLFMLSTKDAYVDQKGEDYRLIVPIDANVVMFSDRPERLVQPISISKLLRAWQIGRDSFANNPPNAAISLGGKKAVVTLSDLTVKDDKAYFKIVSDGGLEDALMPGDVGSLFMVLDSVVIVRRMGAIL